MVCACHLISFSSYDDEQGTCITARLLVDSYTQQMFQILKILFAVFTTLIHCFDTFKSSEFIDNLYCYGGAVVQW